MASCWSTNGVLLTKYFSFTEETISKFSIPRDFNVVQRKERRELLRNELVPGKCRHCKFTSIVHYGNPSNWVRHLKTHEQQHEEYKSSANMSRKRSRSPSREVFKQPQPKKQMLDQPSILDAMNPEKIHERKEKKEKLKQLATDHQKRIDAKVLLYVVAKALPISTVSSESFREMLREIDDRVNVLCSKTLRRNIAAEFTRFKLDLKVRFSKASCICLTADIWGSKNQR